MGEARKDTRPGQTEGAGLYLICALSPLSCVLFRELLSQSTPFLLRKGEGGTDTYFTRSKSNSWQSSGDSLCLSTLAAFSGLGLF